MKPRLERLRGRFLLLACAPMSGLLVSCGAVLWLVWVGPQGVLLSIFLAAAIVLLLMRALSAIWSATSLDLLEEVGRPLRVGEAIAAGRDLESAFEELQAHYELAAKQARKAQEHRRRLLAEIFHALAQPLTTLRCRLELGLRTPRSPEEYRTCLADSLDQAERTVRLILQFRNLAEIIDCGHAGETCRFDESLKIASEEIGALAEVRQIQIYVQPAPAVVVSGNGQCVSQMLFHLLQFSLDSAPAESELLARTERSRGALIFTVESKLEAATKAPDSELQARAEESGNQNPMRTLGLTVAEHILESLGGSLERDLLGDCQVLRATLPVVGVPEAPCAPELVAAHSFSSR